MIRNGRLIARVVAADETAFPTQPKCRIILPGVEERSLQLLKRLERKSDILCLGNQAPPSFETIAGRCFAFDAE